MRTRMVLHEKGIDFEVHEVDLSNKSEEFLRVSPYGKVPVLRVNETSLYESNIVNEYLDEVYESPKLMPQNPAERATVRSWMAFADDYFFPSVFRVIRHQLGRFVNLVKVLVHDVRFVQGSPVHTQYRDLTVGADAQEFFALVA